MDFPLPGPLLQESIDICYNSWVEPEIFRPGCQRQGRHTGPEMVEPGGWCLDRKAVALVLVAAWLPGCARILTRTYYEY